MIETERVGTTLIVHLRRYAARNAINQEMAAGIDAAMSTLDSEPALRVGVVTGDRVFCAGQDLTEAAAGRFARTPGRGWFGLVERPPDKPLIAAVEGAALAGGLELALACDLIVAATDATFGIPEVRSGLVAVAGGLVRLPLRVPYHVATALALTGRPMTAPQLHHHGMVTELAPPGGALDAAIALAARIAANPPAAVRHTLRTVRATHALTESAAWTHQARTVSVDDLHTTSEFQEGVRAFLEKRPPAWENWENNGQGSGADAAGRTTGGPRGRAG